MQGHPRIVLKSFRKKVMRDSTSDLLAIQVQDKDCGD